MSSGPNKEFDYIIAGGGMAGLSLAFRLNNSSLKNKRVLIIDKDEKTANDHTWCFWETGTSLFEEIVFHKWKNLWFHGPDGYSKRLDIRPFQYKMIRSVDFYSHVKKELARNRLCTFLKAEIESVGESEVATSEGVIRARELIFDSFSRKAYDNPRYHNLVQHFLGWTVRCEKRVFDPEAATLFDFRIEQDGDCRFIYELPFSATEALVEFTVFSNRVLERPEYERALSDYLDKKCESYEMAGVEHGVIPMSDEPHVEKISKKVIRIGTSGGYVKPSTGYSFMRTQRRLALLVENLEAAQASRTLPMRMPEPSKWKAYLDSVFLDVLENRRHPAAGVFSLLFEKNEPSEMLRFLDEETSFREDLAIMRTVPVKPFAAAAVAEFLRRQRNPGGSL